MRLRLWRTEGTQMQTEVPIDIHRLLTDSQPMGISQSSCITGRNSAHSSHTMLLRELGFAIERSAMWYFLEAGFLLASADPPPTNDTKRSSMRCPSGHRGDKLSAFSCSSAQRV